LDVAHLITEDDTPVDNLFSEKQMRLLTEPLYSSWRPGKDFVAMANVALYRSVASAPLVPDMLLSMGVRAPEDMLRKENRSYLMWEYGKAPEVVIEIVSNKKGGEDTDKMPWYAAAGVSYYVVFDPAGHLSQTRLRTYENICHRFKSYEQGPMFLEFGLRLVEWSGEYEGATAEWLRWAQLDGTLILTGAEASARERSRADGEARRADGEARRADGEARRADEEARRAEKLAERLRAAGIDPESV
jgi:Uma2 family endonuclease